MKTYFNLKNITPEGLSLNKGFLNVEGKPIRKWFDPNEMLIKKALESRSKSMICVEFINYLLHSRHSFQNNFTTHIYISFPRTSGHR